MNDLQTVNALASAIDSMIDKISGVEETAVNYLGKIDNLQEYAQEQAQKKVDEMCERITTEVNAKLEEQRTVLVGMISKTADAVTENMKAVEPIVNFDLDSVSSVGDAVSFLKQVQEAFAGPYRKAEILITAISTDILPKLMELATMIDSLLNLKNLIPTLKCKDNKTVNVDKLNVHVKPITESDVGVCPNWNWEGATYNLSSSYQWLSITPDNSNTNFYAVSSDRVIAKGNPNTGFIQTQALPSDADNWWRCIIQEKTNNNYLFVLGSRGRVIYSASNTSDYSWNEFPSIRYSSSDGEWRSMSSCKYVPNGPYFLSSTGHIYYGENKRSDLRNDRTWKQIYCDDILDSDGYYRIYMISHDGYVAIAKNYKNEYGMINYSLISQNTRIDTDDNKYWVGITKIRSTISNQSSYFMAVTKDGHYAISDDGINWKMQTEQIPYVGGFYINSIIQGINTDQILTLNSNGKIYIAQ